ncbi:MAG: lysophospholipase L1-like esterase [Cyclobacteriaceae bacterium]|jgi:lysophospholipase L1-like esterase
MINYFLVFLTFLFSFACADSKESSNLSFVEIEKQEPLEGDTEKENTSKTILDTMKFLALGDSYTIGESVANDLRWPVQLVLQLADQGFIFNEESPRIIAKTGWTTDELQSAIDDDKPSNDFDLVSLLIGVNNQYRGFDIINFKKEFESLLKQAITFADGDRTKVFVLSIPDWGVMPFAEGRDRNKIAEEIDAYNAIGLSLCQQYQVRYFDITPISRKATINNELVASDGLHPSGEMYRLWVADILSWAKETLSN